jgi:hypothetical protein
MKALMRAATMMIGLTAFLAVAIPASASVSSPGGTLLPAVTCHQTVGNTMIIEECSNFTVAVTDIYSSTITAHFEVWNRQNTSEWRNGPEATMSRDFQESIGPGWNETCGELWQRVDGTTVRLGSIVCTSS